MTKPKPLSEEDICLIRKGHKLVYHPNIDYSYLKTEKGQYIEKDRLKELLQTLQKELRDGMTSILQSDSTINKVDNYRGYRSALQKLNKYFGVLIK